MLKKNPWLAELDRLLARLKRVLNEKKLSNALKAAKKQANLDRYLKKEKQALLNKSFVHIEKDNLKRKAMQKKAKFVNKKLKILEKAEVDWLNEDERHT